MIEVILGEVIELHPIILPHLHKPIIFVLGIGDVELLTTALALFKGQNPLPVSFIFKDNSVAGESVEIFTLTIATILSLAGYRTSLVLMGTILDDDSEFKF